MGTGSGHIAIGLSLAGFDAEGCDICETAVRTALEHAAKAGSKARFFVSDLWRQTAEYDLVVFNPPLSGNPSGLKGLFRRLPLSEKLAFLHCIFFGGYRRQLLHRLVAGSKPHLRPGGRLMVLLTSPELRDVRRLGDAHGFAFRVVEKSGQYRVAELAARSVP